MHFNSVVRFRQRKVVFGMVDVRQNESLHYDGIRPTRPTCISQLCISIYCPVSQRRLAIQSCSHMNCQSTKNTSASQNKQYVNDSTNQRDTRVVLRSEHSVIRRSVGRVSGGPAVAARPTARPVRRRCRAACEVCPSGRVWTWSCVVEWLRCEHASPTAVRLEARLDCVAARFPWPTCHEPVKQTYHAQHGRTQAVGPSQLCAGLSVYSVPPCNRTHW